jgi:hypothetical protein
MLAYRFDHIAIGAASMADGPPLLVGVLGGVPDSGGSADAFSFGCWQYAGGGRIEVIEPRGAEGFLHRFLAARGPGIHHVTYRVERLVEATARARACGLRIVGYDDRDPDWKTAFLHPKEAMGVVVQLAEARDRSGPRRWESPPGPALPPPVTILGLRMRARSRDRARLLWPTVLGGVAAEAGEEMVFRWPGSPMRVTVGFEPEGTAEEGPVAIEFSSERSVTVPGDLAQRLGTVFLSRPAAG